MDEGQHTKIRCISTREQKRIRENLSAAFTMTSARIGCPGSSRTKDGRESVLSVHVADRQTYTVREQDSAFRTQMLPREIYHHPQNPRRFFVFCLRTVFCLCGIPLWIDQTSLEGEPRGRASGRTDTETQGSEWRRLDAVPGRRLGQGEGLVSWPRVHEETLHKS